MSRAAAISETPGRPALVVARRLEPAPDTSAPDEFAITPAPSNDSTSTFARGLSGWLASAAAHAALLLLLAAAGMTAHSASERPGIVASRVETETALEDLEELPVELEAADLSSPVLAPPAELPLAVELGESGRLAPAELSDLGLPRAGFGKLAGGAAADDFNAGRSGSAKFFGVQSVGRDVVYLVDNSRSMDNGKFEEACYELLRSVGRLDDDQRFYVIFFSNGPYPLFHPSPADGLLPASNETFRRLQRWISRVPLDARTDAREAVLEALALEPDAIFLLSDGGFTDDTHRVLMQMDLQGKPPIHTIGFRSRVAESVLAEISDRFQGTYRYVP